MGTLTLDEHGANSRLLKVLPVDELIKGLHDLVNVPRLGGWDQLHSKGLVGGVERECKVDLGRIPCQLHQPRDHTNRRHRHRGVPAATNNHPLSVFVLTKSLLTLFDWAKPQCKARSASTSERRLQGLQVRPIITGGAQTSSTNAGRRSSHGWRRASQCSCQAVLPSP